MRLGTGHRGLASLCIVALLAYGSPALAGSDARLEGRVVGVDGRAAVGIEVVPLDAAGEVVGRSALDGEGMYRFRDLPAATYGVALESAEGLAAPVLQSDTRIRDGELARRDIKLVDASAVSLAPANEGGRSIGERWAGLNKAAKAWWTTRTTPVTTFLPRRSSRSGPLRPAQVSR